ncbi:universal stress protein [Corallococcus macrosporus]|uniref:Universal stress protein n=1 Tax=Corallococcus macrosporus DSM 14697 TaxID=1189310 RepID=A0A250K032_9BACT|nr:universal stress protein [Corallococcus macrosporus]ATB49353.1 universal stress protein [Corallococcus macrosporus DSM 14697]
MIVPTDFSEASAHAVGRAAHLPLAEGAKVLLTHALPSRMPTELGARALDATARELERIAERLRKGLRAEGTSATVETHIARGKPVEAILRRAKAFGAELIVLGRHGAKPLRDMFLGSTAENVIRGGVLPVLIANRRATGPYLRPVVAVDADEPSKRAARFVPTLMTTGAELTLVHAYDVPLEYAVFPGLKSKERTHYQNTFKASAERKLRALQRELDALGVPYHLVMENGGSRSIVLEFVDDQGADLLALGTRARSGVAFALLGSVATDLIREAKCDVLVVREAGHDE